MSKTLFSRLFQQHLQFAFQNNSFSRTFAASITRKATTILDYMRENLPRTGRTLGNAMSNIGSAGRRTATLSSQEYVPLRLLLQRASQSWASCTSRQITFPFTGHQPISQVIVNATIQLVSIYVTRTIPLACPSPSRCTSFSSNEIDVPLQTFRQR